jgi:putative peptide zinc metalloprotease protein
MTVTTDIENARLAHGTELLGEYAGSGFKEPPYLVRRCDGQIVQLPRLLYAVAEHADGSRDDADLAADVSISVRRRLTAEQVRYLVDEKLRPLGIVAGDDDAPPPPGASLLFALNVKKAVLQPDLVNVIAAILSPLFWPPVVAVVLLGVAGVDAWLFAVHGIAQGIRGALYDPAALLLLIALVLVATAFHECGHAAGTRYGGARPGAMGAGLYLVWPAFYTDISDSYRLSRGGRLRADLGGVYFNTVFMLGIAAAYWFTGFEPVLLLIPLQHIEVIHQLLPVLRLDGYYVLTDLTGVPDILSRIRPILKSLVPGYPNDRRVDELKPWVRVVVTAYVVTIVPLLLVLCGLMVVTAPRVFATAAGAFVAHLHAARHALDARLAVPLVVQALELVLLVLPPAGLAWTLLRLARRLVSGVWGATERRPRARNVLVAVTSIVATATFLNWWSTGAYRPIGKGDRGTVGSIAQLSWFHRHARPHPRAQRVHDAPPAPSLPAGRTPPPSRTATQPASTRPDAPTTTSHTPLTTTSQTPLTTTSQTPAPSPHRANTPTNTRTSATTTTRATTTAPPPATTTAPNTTTESTTTATTTTQTTTTQTATTTSP